MLFIQPITESKSSEKVILTFVINFLRFFFQEQKYYFQNFAVEGSNEHIFH